MNKQKLITLIIIGCLSLNACSAKPENTVKSNPSVAEVTADNSRDTKPAVSVNDDQTIEEMVNSGQTALVAIGEQMRQSLSRDTDLASRKLTNTLVDLIDVQVLSENDRGCEVEISYPDMVALLDEALLSAPDISTSEEIDAFYLSLRDALLTKAQNGSLTRETKRLSLNYVKQKDGSLGIEWTDELINAMSAGLYDALQEELENE